MGVHRAQVLCQARGRPLQARPLQARGRPLQAGGRPFCGSSAGAVRAEEGQHPPVSSTASCGEGWQGQQAQGGQQVQGRPRQARQARLEQLWQLHTVRCIRRYLLSGPSSSLLPYNNFSASGPSSCFSPHQLGWSKAALCHISG